MSSETVEVFIDGMWVTYELTPVRAAIIERLKLRAWFNTTMPGLQVGLIELPANHDRFLDDLASRSETIGGNTVVSLEALRRANYGLIPVFKVLTHEGRSNTYEYFSWRHGCKSGSKGVIFIKGEDGLISHFINLYSGKFAIGGETWDSLGGFADPEKGLQLSEVIVAEIREELGIDTLEFEVVHELGIYQPDAGMTNSTPSLFAAIISAAVAKNLPVDPDNPDPLELRGSVVIHPIADLGRHIGENPDGFFLATIVRSVASGIIPATFLQKAG